MPIGTEPAMTVSGAAAATTMKTMEPGPSRPLRRWCSAASADAAIGGGLETVAMLTSGEWQQGCRGGRRRPRAWAPSLPRRLHGRHMSETSALHRTRDADHTFLI